MWTLSRVETTENNQEKHTKVSCRHLDADHMADLLYTITDPHRNDSFLVLILKRKATQNVGLRCGHGVRFSQGSFTTPLPVARLMATDPWKSIDRTRCLCETKT